MAMKETLSKAEIDNLFIIGAFSLLGVYAGLNAQASMRLAHRLIEAHERNYWTPDEATLAALRSAGDAFEDRLEGIVEGVAA